MDVDLRRLICWAILLIAASAAPGMLFGLPAAWAQAAAEEEPSEEEASPEDEGSPPPPEEEPAAEPPADAAPSPEAPPASPFPIDESPDAAAQPTPAAPGKLPRDEEGAAPLAADDDKERPALDTKHLIQIVPGTTTREQLREVWGEPAQTEKIAGGARELYLVEKLGRVRITSAEGVVESVAVRLEQPVPLTKMVVPLGVNDIEAVEILDEAGDLMGNAYPERGVLFGFSPDAEERYVVQVVIEPVDAQSFLGRAESRLPTRYADCLADVKQALKINPQSARAYWLKGELALRSGNLEEAQRSARKAQELEPADFEHTLLLARALAESGDYPEATKQVRRVLAAQKVPLLVRARAWYQAGDYLALSAKRDYAGAIKHHQQAIKVAEPLIRDKRFAVRRAAKELMVDAHLAVAYDIGWGRWQQKDKVVPKWVDRAELFAKELEESDGGGDNLRLRMCTGALAALAGMAAPPDANVWIDELTQLGKKSYGDAADPLYKAALAWQLGRALTYAVEIEAARHAPERTLQLGGVAVALFEESEAAAGKLPTHNYWRGRLCYRMGVVCAVEHGDHVQALVWFDRAAPLLESPVPVAVVDAGAQGEKFVSMAVSYWEQSKRGEALRLTRQGVKLMEQAVSDGLLETKALAVPYANLANMHEQLGDFDEAKKYSGLADRYQGPAVAKREQPADENSPPDGAEE